MAVSSGSYRWKMELSLLQPSARWHIYVGSYDGNLYAIADSGSYGLLKWKFTTGGAVDGSPAVDGCGVIYVGSNDSTMYAINPDGSLRWSFKTGGGIESSATIRGDGILYFGSFDGNLYALGTGAPDGGSCFGRHTQSGVHKFDPSTQCNCDELSSHSTEF